MAMPSLKQFPEAYNKMTELKNCYDEIKTGGSFIGVIQPFLVTKVPDGWLECNGALVSRTTYPEFWSWIQENAPIVSETDWQTAASTQTSVGYYSSGDGSTTFRLPRIVDFVQGGVLADSGKFIGAGLPNITGRVGACFDAQGGNGTSTGAFNKVPTAGGAAGGNDFIAYLPNIDASRCSAIYGNSTTVQPPAVKMVYCVKAYHGVVEQGTICLPWNTRLSSHEYVIGDIAYSTNLPTWARLECVSAGKTDISDPVLLLEATNKKAGILIKDGSVTWILDDTRDSTPIGNVTSRMYVPDGYITANGATVKRADYPRLVELANKHNLWTSDTTNNLGLFGVGDGSTTMVLPNWVGKMEQFAATAGGTVAAGLPNVLGYITANRLGISNYYGAEGNGALYPQASSAHSGWYGAGIDTGITNPLTIVIDASRSNTIYGASTTVQPPAINVIPIIRY